MRISDIKTCRVITPYDMTLVKVFTDEGVSGVGEAYHGQGVRDVIINPYRSLKKIVVGEDPRNVERLYERMIQRLSGMGTLGGTTVTAISGVELALWDLLGKIVGLPVYQLLGGKFRDRVRIYADSGRGPTMDPASWKERAEERKALGWDAYKFDLDMRGHRAETFNRCLSNEQINLMVKQVAALREGLGYDVDLAIDFHWSYSTHTAIKLANKLEEYDLMWLEDPVPPENWEAYKKVKEHTNIPILGGESWYRKYGYKDYIINQALDILAPDIPRMGGLMEFKKVAILGDLYYMPMAPHNIASPVGTLACAHAAASIRNYLCMEVHYLDESSRYWDDMVTGISKPVIKKGYIEIPDKPGIGVELNEKVILEHSIEGEVDEGFFQ
jgi:gluconate/galactonate dehydratase